MVSLSRALKDLSRAFSGYLDARLCVNLPDNLKEQWVLHFVTAMGGGLGGIVLFSGEISRGDAGNVGQAPSI